MASSSGQSALFRKIDCLRLPVPDLDSAIEFYAALLGQELIWRREAAAGLRLPESDAELVLQTERPASEVDLPVRSADAAAQRFAEAAGRVVERPFDIEIGRCTVVQDPWGNRLVLLDMSKGRLIP